MPILDVMTDVLLATLFGGMVFFPSVVAPLVFRVLDTDDAGRFLRALFPRYYAFVIATSGLAAFGAALANLGHGLVLLLVAVSTLVVRQWLVPRINGWRDRSRAGDEAATVYFDRGHRLSVWINMAQMIAVLVLIVVR